MPGVSSVDNRKPLLSILIPNAQLITKPNEISSVPRKEASKAISEIPELKFKNPLVTDTFELSNPKKSVTVEDVKKLFPTGKLDENNYLINSMKETVKKFDKKVTTIDLSPELTSKDYQLIKDFMNKDNGKYIDLWNGCYDTKIRNIEKLALFVRTMQISNQAEKYLNFPVNEWEIVVNSIIKTPKNLILPVFEYKVDSRYINGALSNKKSITDVLVEKIKAITDFIMNFTTKNDITVYRGEGSFDILQSATINGEKINLAKFIADKTEEFQNLYKNHIYDQETVDEFTNTYLKGAKIHQQRFMSTAMDPEGSKNFAKKIFWTIKVPKGTKGTSIENYNVEAKSEAEFLAQRDGILAIDEAQYDPKKNMWFFDATIKQGDLTTI